MKLFQESRPLADSTIERLSLMKKTALWFAVVGFFVGFAFVTYYAGNAFNPKSPGAFFHILGGIFFALFGLFIGWALGDGDKVQQSKP
jgi:hypothetical protein